MSARVSPFDAPAASEVSPRAESASVRKASPRTAITSGNGSPRSADNGSDNGDRSDSDDDSEHGSDAGSVMSDQQYQFLRHGAGTLYLPVTNTGEDYRLTIMKQAIPPPKKAKVPDHNKKAGVPGEEKEADYKKKEKEKVDYIKVFNEHVVATRAGLAFAGKSVNDFARATIARNREYMKDECVVS